MDFDTLVVCCDLTEDSPDFYDLASHEAKMRGAKLFLLHIMECPPPYSFGAPGTYEEFLGSWFQEQKKQADASLKKIIAEHFHDQEVTSAAIRAEYSVGEQIADFAKEKNAEGILILSSGKGRINTFFLGSTVQRVLQHAHCPVIVVPPQQ